MGRGRRGGGRGGSFKYAKQEPFVCFPDAELPDLKGVTVDEHLIRLRLKLQHYWKAAPDYLEETVSKNGHSTEIGKFSNRDKVGASIRRGSLSQILKHRSFPVELIEGSKGWQGQLSRKKVQWNPDSEFQKLDIFEKLERLQVHNDKEEKKEGENEDEDEDQENDESE